MFYLFRVARWLVLTVICFFFLFVGCMPTNSQFADMIITGADFYTANDQEIEALAISGDRIMAVGSKEDIMRLRGNDTEVIDARGTFVMPGFIEGHGHFFGLGQSLMELDFMQAESWDTIVGMVTEKAKNTPEGTWIIGRGWHQEKWRTAPGEMVGGYPHHRTLSAVTPNHPVMLVHASGHALFANKKAMELSGVLRDIAAPKGGHIVRDAANKATGVFEENAMEIIRNTYQNYLKQEDDASKRIRRDSAIRLAQDLCLENGICSFQDAGSDFELLAHYEQMARSGTWDIRMWAMLRHSYDEMKTKLNDFPKINIGDHRFTCRAIKTDLDGALGAHGAWLLSPYSDKPGFVGQNTTPIEEVERIAKLAKNHGMQLCVHAIGDRANREVLDIAQRLGDVEPLRWRIEHAQHLHPDDIKRFKTLGLIASMQAIHCTSDAPFVVKRLGFERAQQGAYAWRSLLDAGAKLANGTDVPVEPISPFKSIYASVTRQHPNREGAFFPEQAMTRDEALKSYTIWNAYAAFEEDIKGTLEIGKLADIIIVSHNLLDCPDEDLLRAKVLKTIVGGKIVYSR